MRSDDVVFRILVNNKPIREYEGPDDSVWVEGRKGSKYKIRIKNNSNKRRLVVVTVDGLSVMDGEPGSYDSSGYILGSWGKIDIPGFRLNNNDVAKFVFDSSDKSYAASKNLKENNGVIGCAVFEDAYSYYSNDKWDLVNRVPTLTISPFGDNVIGGNVPGCDNFYSTTCGASSKTTASADAFSTKGASQNIGTKFGEREEFSVNTVEFSRSDHPEHVFEIRYDDRDGLKRRGIDMRPKPTAALPSAFPKEQEMGCAPPDDWNE